MRKNQPVLERLSNPHGKPRLLGDRVAALVMPVAAFSDKNLKTNFAECAGCKERIKWLNEQHSKAKKLFGIKENV